MLEVGRRTGSGREIRKSGAGESATNPEARSVRSGLETGVMGSRPEV